MRNVENVLNKPACWRCILISQSMKFMLIKIAETHKTFIRKENATAMLSELREHWDSAAWVTAAIAFCYYEDVPRTVLYDERIVRLELNSIFHRHS